MMTKNVGICECEFSADVVPYMYGEMSTAGISAFESHVLECDECTDELAAVSFARYEVYDWKKLEFDPLPTPRILPFEDPVPVHAAASWFDGLRTAFGGWLIPSSAFAAIAVAVVAGGVFYVSNTDIPTVSQVVEPEITVQKPSPSTEASVGTGKTAGGSNERSPTPVRIAASKNLSEKRILRVPKTITPRPAQAVARDVKSKKLTVPRLNEFTDDEDTSLRLAQLFEDVDTRD